MSEANPVSLEARLTRRQDTIVEVLEVEGFVSVRGLSKVLGVSDMTVRRDLKRLAHLGHVKLVHGGAALTHGTLRTPGFVARATIENSSKQRIANAALAFVSHGDTLAIDAGTTTYALAEKLGDLTTGKIITNSIPVLQLLLGRDPQNLVVLGGEVAPESQALVGPISVASTHDLRARTLFLGAAAIDARGAYVETSVERPTKLAMMEVADRVILLSDASKFVVSAPARLCAFDDIDVLITDAEPPAAIRLAAEKRGTEILIAE